MVIHGFKVIESAAHPKIQLNKEVNVSDEFRDEFNSWLISYFGYNEIVEDGKAIINEEEKTLIVNARTYHELRRESAGERVIFG